ncbi:hypothetical protein AWC27_24705 [Mycobacterium szulgai]|uniref:Uncharacterized protein n=1 Tax=Mycobacterium szulgai TaxID=1787 RepID=A0A1X2ESB1_MYCSZ|nr:hypothetical protein [Mycobacterium szulgai]MCV7074542.1 hypothetical protein [Mycobacterium szulgai]ORX09082.1 hypothetical protein AWC27_24705 [Mycobacterium szulgai]
MAATLAATAAMAALAAPGGARLVGLPDFGADQAVQQLGKFRTCGTAAGDGGVLQDTDLGSPGSRTPPGANRTDARTEVS